MTKQFTVDVDPQGGNMMTALKIPESRCKELCGLVDEIAHQQPEWNLGQILQEAVEKHAVSFNEALFLSFTLGSEVGEQVGRMKEHVEGQIQHLADLFARTQKRNKSHSFSYN